MNFYIHTTVGTCLKLQVSKVLQPHIYYYMIICEDLANAFEFTTFCSDEKILAAELKSVRWLEVCGRFDTEALTPEKLYEVVFVVKIKEYADGLESITLRLIIPNKSSKDVTVNLMNVTAREQWIEVPVGELFTISELKKKKKREEIEIFLYETEKLNCKQGLVIKGIVIRPKVS